MSDDLKRVAIQSDRITTWATVVIVTITVVMHFVPEIFKMPLATVMWLVLAVDIWAFLRGRSALHKLFNEESGK